MQDYTITHIAFFGWPIELLRQLDGQVPARSDRQSGGRHPVDRQFTLPGMPQVIVATSDIEAALAEAAARGGRTLVPKRRIPGVGWFAVFADSTGKCIGLMDSSRAQS